MPNATALFRPPARRAQLRDSTAEEIRRLIISGEAAPGTVLRMEPLAERVQTSVTPVREALLLLAQEGWVEQEPHRGFRVIAIRRSDVEDLHDLHAYLFGQLAGLAAVRSDPALVADLRALDAAIRATPARELRQIEEHNHALHEAVNSAADSPRLSRFASSSRFLPGGFGWGSVPGWLEHVRDGHAPLLDALEARDAAAASAEMAAHIRFAGELLLAHLDAIGFFAHATPA